jgi:hypothetical protein
MRATRSHSPSGKPSEKSAVASVHRKRTPATAKANEKKPEAQRPPEAKASGVGAAPSKLSAAKMPCPGSYADTVANKAKTAVQ